MSDTDAVTVIIIFAAVDLVADVAAGACSLESAAGSFLLAAGCEVECG